MDLIPPEQLVTVILGVSSLLVGFVLGLVSSYSRGRSRVRGLQQEMKEVEREYKDLIRTAKRLRAENDLFSRFLVLLPDFTRQINQEATRSNVIRLVADVGQRLFESEQVALFTSDRGGATLSLAAGQGLPSSLKVGLRVGRTEGRIGWVAEHQVAMSTEDFMAQSRVGQRPLEGDPPGLQLELAAPLVHSDHLQGVLAVGGLSVHHKGEKQMLKMIADMGSIALHNCEQFSQLQQMAAHDGLTKLANKGYFVRQLGIMINEAETARRPLAVFIFDIDHFKSYNDQNGHLAGDELLRQIGRLMHETLRDNDVPARYGGEEFIVALPDTDQQGALVVAETVRRTVEQFHFPNQESQPGGNLTVSGGLAVFPVDGRTSTDLIGHADRALYVAKANGRNRIVAYRAPEFGDTRPDDLYENLGS